ncbi:MAG: polysaccharide biosynthesis tyrosine autokinase [Deltaproteobacteria bacterium]|nr:polysaccharide biosynthesis tyrosine autokinase [Deltaproteobacteria bacterium]
MVTASQPPRQTGELVELPLDDWEPMAEEPGPLVNVQRYLDALRRRWWIPLVTVAVCAVVVTAWTVRQPKLYRAAASMVIETRMPKLLTGVEEVVDMGAGGWVPDSFYETEHEVMRSRAVAAAASVALRLPQNDQFNGLAGVTDQAERSRRLAELDPADLTMGRYTVEPDRRSSVVRIGVVDEDPRFAADLANAVVDAYRDLNVDKRVEGNRDASRWLGVQHGDLRSKLETSEDKLIAFMEENDVLNASMESQLAEVMQRASAFNAQLAEEEAAAIRDTLNVAALRQVREDPALVDTLPEIQAAGVVNSLKTKLVELRATEVDLTARYQAEHPRMKLLQEQMTTLRNELQREIDAVLTALERQKASREASIVGLREALDVERGKEARLNKLALDYNRLKRERDSQAQLFDMVTSRMKEADITSALPYNNVRVLDRALAPKGPFRPNLTINLLAAIMFGVVLGIALIILLELLDTTVKNQLDVERLKLPFLGLLPEIDTGAGRGAEQRASEGQERDLFVLRSPRSAVAECARFIRTSLVFMSPDRPLKTVVVTSPGPEEGKTTTAVSIAITMAQTGSKTLLVDTDMRRPRLHKVFGVGSDVGLSTLLVGETGLDATVQKTELDKLDVLVCGPPPPNPAEMLLSQHFKDLVAELGKRYDRVIFDAPPLGPVTDPAIVGALTDGVVLVLKCAKTRKDTTAAALKALADSKARVLGAILNEVDVTSKRYAGAYYAYYHKYGGYYGGDDDAAKKPAGATS